MGRRRGKIQKEPITQNVLLDMLKLGAALTVAMVAPNALTLFKSAGRKTEWDPYYPSSIERHTMKLWRKGFVDVHETETGFTVVITEKGKQELLRYDIEAMSVPRQDPWDEKWRMVFFDIPTGHEARNIFREKLISMGFFQMQKSVYIHPFPCAKQIKFLREVYFMPDSVKLAVIEHLENDEDLRRFFRLG